MTRPAGSITPKFNVGDLVALRSDPNTLLPVLEVIPGGAECRYRVFQNNLKATYYESQLQVAPVAAEEGKMLTVRELHAHLTSLHILSPSTANLFSLRSGRVRFVPYQYRPVLKLMLHVPNYRRRWEEKLAWYRAHGILPHEEGGGSG